MDFLFCVAVFICASACLLSAGKLFLNAQEDTSERFYDGDYKSGYAQVREGAFMFWWLYYAGGDRKTADDKPLILVIPDGPGIPASGVSNFLEIGPQDLLFNDRNSSWVHENNVLFIDTPVGTGFSYVTNDSLFPVDSSRQAYDIMELMKQFLTENPQFKTVPTHIYAKGYGAKVGADVAEILYFRSIESLGRIDINVKTLILGSPFVSPKDSVAAYPEYVYQMGFIDESEYQLLIELSSKIVNALENDKFEDAEDLGSEMIKMTTEVFPFYMNNAMKPTCTNIENELVDFMDHTIKPALSNTIPSGIPKYQYMNETVYNALIKDIMKSGTPTVQAILQQTPLHVVIYNGNLDAITPIAGTLKWANSLPWPGQEAFQNATDVYMPGFPNGHYKTHERLTFWWVTDAGHNVPEDNPQAMANILKSISEYHATILLLCLNQHKVQGDPDEIIRRVASQENEIPDINTTTLYCI